MGNKASNADRAGGEAIRRNNARKGKDALKEEYDFVFKEDDPRHWLPTDLTESKLNLLNAKLCPAAPPPTNNSLLVPASSAPTSKSSYNGSRQIEMTPFKFQRSRGQHPEGSFSRSSNPSLLVLSKSLSSSSTIERSPSKMAQGDPYCIDANTFDKNYKPAWMPDVKISSAKTDLTSDTSSGILRRSRSFFGFRLRKSISDRTASRECESEEKIKERSKSLTTNKSFAGSFFQKWRRISKSENDVEKPVPVDKSLPKPLVAKSSSVSVYTFDSKYTYTYSSPDSRAPKPPAKPPGKPPDKPPDKKPPPKKDPKKPAPSPKKEDKKKKDPNAGKKPPMPPKKKPEKPKPKQEKKEEKKQPAPKDGGGKGGGSRSESYTSEPSSEPKKGGKTPGDDSASQSQVQSESTSGYGTPSGGKRKGPPKKRPPPPPVFISNCCSGLSCKKPLQSPADRLENVDIVEELTYCCPTEGGGCSNNNNNCNNCCCDYYSCCNDCGECKLVPNCCCCSNNSNPVKYSRRQRFNFNDGKGRGDDCCDGPPFCWENRPPNPYDEIPVGKNPVLTCCECEDSCNKGKGQVLPSESGTYFFDAERRSFVPVLEIETPETPPQEIHDEIIDEEPILTNIEPIIQPMMQPVCGGCCPLPPFCGVMGQPCCVNPCEQNHGDSDKENRNGKNSKNSKSSGKGKGDDCSFKPDPGMMGLCGMNMPGLANMGPYGSLIVPQFSYQPPPCPPCNPCCPPCPPPCPCCPQGEPCPCCPCPPCQPLSVAPICFPPYPYGGCGCNMGCQGQGCQKKKKKKDKNKKHKGNESTQYNEPYNTGTNTDYGAGSDGKYGNDDA